MSQTNVPATIPVETTRRERMFGVEPVSKVLSELKKRAEHRHQRDVDRIIDLNLRWEDQSQRFQGGYYAKVDGQDMRLTEGAFRSLNRLIGGPANLRHWDRYSDRNAFPKAVRNILDNNSAATDGIQLVHNEKEINSFLPTSYQVRSGADMLQDIVEQLDENIGDIRGINSTETGDGDHYTHRVVLGNNIMPSADASRGQYMMFTITGSEVGLLDTRTAMGLYRHICTNSAIHVATVSKWNNRMGGEERFREATSEVIRLHGMLSSQFAAVFETYLRAPIEHEVGEILNTMKAVGAISKEHFESAKVRAEMPTEDGRPAETYYDLFNAVTAGAKDLASIPAREQGEQAAMTLFTTPGGLYPTLRTMAARKRLSNRERLVGLN